MKAYKKVVCPNCNQQTEVHARTKVENIGKFCKNCNKPQEVAVAA